VMGGNPSGTILYENLLPQRICASPACVYAEVKGL
jgi:hypothetical protein